MKLSLLHRFTSRDADVPGDVLAALVDSLYAPVVSLALGSASAVSLAFSVAIFVDERPLFICATALAIVSALRIASVLAYRRRDRAKARDADALAMWEAIYAVGAYSFAGALGALNAVALTVTNEAVVHMLVLTVSTGCTAGGVIRNSGVRNIALGQVLFNVVPLCIAAAMRHEPAYYILSFVFAVFALSAFDICFYHSTNTLRVLLARKEKAMLAAALAEQNRRFDAALNNMPQGLCMFDADSRLVVANTRMEQIFGGAVDLAPGRTIDEIAEKLAEAGCLSWETARACAQDIRGHLAAGRSACTIVPLPDGRMVSATQAPQSGGGAVVIYEDVTERHEAEMRVRYLATHDVLTGLPNRTHFTQLLRDAIRTPDSAVGVLFIDLDRFKSINDTLGHSAGDALLREVSARLKASLRQGDAAARLGGDEFVVMLRNAGTPQQAASAAAALLARLAAPMTIAGQECAVSASIGVALHPADGADEDALLENADSAMYLAKATGKSGVRLFSPKAKAQTLQGLKLEASMRHAVARNEFLVLYQPQRNIVTGEVTGVEALLRWRHPEFGMMTPDRFIPIAEASGLIVPIGKWVLETACAQHVKWLEQGLGPLSVAVNLSPRQLYDDHILTDISEALANSGMAPQWLELEITESMVMQDVRDAIAVLHAIKQAGAKLAIDDFGAGYSSLSLVKQMPIDTIKIDRSFVNDVLTDPNGRTIAEAVISLGRALKLRVVAEGVETQAQEAFLRERGCDDMQGYLFSRPLEREALLSFISDYNLARLRALAKRPTAAARASA